MKTAGKIVSRILLVILIVAVLAGAGGLFYFKSYLPNTVAPQSFPQTDGEIQVNGLDGQVDVYRDAMGIPHIYATTSHDIFFAQGYIHAQDRFWQMDAWRHIGSGELSEMFGGGQLETDMFLRTLGWRKTAEAEWAGLDADTKAMLQAYADGVNAYLKDHSGTALSLEYAVLGLLSPDYVIEPWEPVHSLTWGKAMAWDLRGNMGDEIERAELLKVLTPEQLALIYPEYPKDHPVIVNKIGEGEMESASTGFDSTPLDYATLDLDSVSYNASLLDPALGPLGDGIGSNSWAVSGQLTDTGMPYLVNDPHLGIQMPSIWYQVALHCVEKTDDCPFQVAGFSFAGVPGVVIGHNDRIAWGFTNVGPDVMDLYIEKVNPENPNQYEFNGEWVDFETYEETIRVVGGEPVTISVRKTRHGPVISETYGPTKDLGDPEDETFIPFKDRVGGVELPEQYVVSLSWTALTPSSPFEAIWGFDRAQNWEEFREAAKDFHVPAQNLLYADVDGNIGYQMPGDVPIRKNGDGTLPVPGWTDEYDWEGYIPFEELPYAFNPEEGYIVTANNQVNPWDYPYLITKDWDYGYRAQRIVDMIESAPGKIDKDYMRFMHGDGTDLNAQSILPVWSQINYDAATPNQAYALDLMQKWDTTCTADSQACAVYQWFWWNLAQNTLNDNLPERNWVSGGSQNFETFRLILPDPGNFFWDDASTADIVETRDDIFIASLAETVDQLEKEHGKDPAKWPRWGELHGATFENGTLGKSGVFLIEDLFNRGPFETGGGQSLVNATGWDIGNGFYVDWLPSMRMIVDLGDLNASLTVHTTGQSGHAYHPHYDDMAPLWANVDYYPMWWDQDAIIADAEGHLALKP